MIVQRTPSPAPLEHRDPEDLTPEERLVLLRQYRVSASSPPRITIPNIYRSGKKQLAGLNKKVSRKSLRSSEKVSREGARVRVA
jgi:hypothetical protein